MKKEGKNPQQSYSDLSSCLGSLALFTILVLLLLFCSLFFFFPPVSESSWSVPSLILPVSVVFLSTLFIVVTLRKKKGSECEEDEGLVQEMKMQKEIALINIDEQEAESQSDSSFPSDSETTSDSAMDEKFEVNASKISDGETECIDNNGGTESSELDQNSTRFLGIYESSDSDDDLIEINLPRSNFCGIESKLPDFLPEDMFKQEGVMELLAEINEDENLIEIDISMGLNQEIPFSGGGDLDQYSYNVATD